MASISRITFCLICCFPCEIFEAAFLAHNITTKRAPKLQFDSAIAVGTKLCLVFDQWLNVFVYLHLYLLFYRVLTLRIMETHA